MPTEPQANLTSEAEDNFGSAAENEKKNENVDEPAVSLASEVDVVVVELAAIDLEGSDWRCTGSHIPLCPHSAVHLCRTEYCLLSSVNVSDTAW